MRYLGGKFRHAKAIAAVLAEYIPFGGTYVEPFCGACAVAIKVREYRPDVKIICNDLHPYLIAMLKGVADGSFAIPDTLTEQEYQYIKAHKNENPALTGFAGFGCSFAGRWFQGFAKYKEGYRNSYGAALETHNALTRDRPALSTMDFHCGDYTVLAIPAGAVVYCDPPYKDTKPYCGITPFDYSAFLTWIKALAASHDVFMSEYAENVEPGADIVWRRTYLGGLRTGDKTKRPVRTDVLVKV